MLTRLVQHWWVFVLRGVVAIIFGIAAFTWPHLTIATLILLFGAYALVDGAFLIISAISGWSHIEDPWLILLEGLLGIGIGVVTFHAPTVTILGLLIFIAAWSLATGVLEIASAMRLRIERRLRVIFHGQLRQLGGIVSAQLGEDHQSKIDPSRDTGSRNPVSIYYNSRLNWLCSEHP